MGKRSSLSAFNHYEYNTSDMQSMMWDEPELPHLEGNHEVDIIDQRMSFTFSGLSQNKQERGSLHM